jgi:hypothetical protein
MHINDSNYSHIQTYTRIWRREWILLKQAKNEITAIHMAMEVCIRCRALYYLEEDLT